MWSLCQALGPFLSLLPLLHAGAGGGQAIGSVCVFVCVLGVLLKITVGVRV